jgi:hypothetical protein
MRQALINYPKIPQNSGTDSTIQWHKKPLQESDSVALLGRGIDQTKKTAPQPKLKRTRPNETFKHGRNQFQNSKKSKRDSIQNRKLESIS